MKDTAERIIEDLEDILKAMGLSLVEVNAAVVKQVFQIRIVIYKPEGISLKDCEEATKVIRPRLDLLLDSRDMALEITSPGLGRKIKSPREYKVFKGRYVKILEEGQTEWKSGQILDADGEFMTLEIDGKNEKFPLDRIRKGKLDYTMENGGLKA